MSSCTMLRVVKSSLSMLRLQALLLVFISVCSVGIVMVSAGRSTPTHHAESSSTKSAATAAVFRSFRGLTASGLASPTSPPSAAAAAPPPSLFSIAPQDQAEAAAVEMDAMAAGSDVDGIPFVSQNTIPRGTGAATRVLELQDDVLDTSVYPEVTLPLLPDVNLVVVWDAPNKKAEKRLQQLRKKHKQQLKQKTLAQQARAQEGSDQELLEAASEVLDEERFTLTGSVQGYGPGETLVTFVVSASSFFGAIMVPETLAGNGSVIMRTYQIESLAGEANTGVAYQHFTPDLQHGDVAISAASEPTRPVDVVGMASQAAAMGLNTPGQEPAAAGALAGPVSPRLLVGAAGLEAASAGVAATLPVQVTNVPRSRQLLQASITYIDVLMLFTPKAATAMGGLVAAQNKMAAEIGLVNTIYANSQLNVRLNLVGASQVTYTEIGFEKSLTDLQSGKISGAFSLRDQLGADLVQLITTDSQYCGIGYQPSSPNKLYGFTVVQTGCLMSGTSAHEIGHNLGCGHDYYSDPNPYSGWSRCDLGPSNSFSTIMSYGCSNGFRPARIFHHSNPAVSVNRGSTSYPTGDASIGNCAAAITKNAPGVSNYRPRAGAAGSPPPPSPPPPSPRPPSPRPTPPRPSPPSPRPPAPRPSPPPLVKPSPPPPVKPSPPPLPITKPSPPPPVKPSAPPLPVTKLSPPLPPSPQIPAPGPSFTLRTAITSYSSCIDVPCNNANKGMTLQQLKCSTNLAQEFLLVDTGGYWYNIINANGLCMAVIDGSTSPGTRVQTWPCDGSLGQQFGFFSLSGGEYELHPASNKNLCLEIAGQRDSDGALLQQATCSKVTAQRFQIFKA